MKIKLSKRLKHFDSSDFRRAFQWAENIESPTDLSVGTPEEHVNSLIKKAAIRAIKQNKTAYTPVNGIPELREAISRELASQGQINYKKENLTIVPGLTTGQLIVYLSILDPGDEVIIMEPHYPPYFYLAGLAGAKAVPVKTREDFQLDIKAIEKSITAKTKAILINSPNNPTGAVYSESSIRKLVALCRKNNILIISDEIYDEFCYESKVFRPGSIYEYTVTMNGFSKSYAMTGWRLGYIAAPFEIVEAINELQQYIVFASSSIAQYAAVAALKTKPTLAKKYLRKRDLLRSSLESSGIRVNGAQGAYYMFVKTPDNKSDIEFVNDAAKQKLVIVPGRAFSKDHNFVRISYGAPYKEVKRGAKILSSISRVN